MLRFDFGQGVKTLMKCSVQRETVLLKCNGCAKTTSWHNYKSLVLHQAGKKGVNSVSERKAVEKAEQQVNGFANKTDASFVKRRFDKK